jgi:ribosome-binding factor A
MSHRIAQVEATLKKAVAEVLQRDMADPRIDGFISITRVKISPDMRNATIFVSVMPQEKESKNIHGLRHATGHIRTLVLKKMATRTVPRFKFVLDESLKKQAAVMEAIHRGSEKTPAVEDESQSPGVADAPDTAAGKNTEADIQPHDPPASED